MSDSLTLPTQETTHQEDSQLQIDRHIDIGKLLKQYFEKGMTYAELGKIYGVSPQAIHQRIQKFTKNHLNPAELKGFEGNKSSILTLAESVILRKMLEPEALQKASLNNLAYSFQQVFNANRLEKGQSTENISVSATLRADAESIRDLDEEINRLGLSDVDQDQVIDVTEP